MTVSTAQCGPDDPCETAGPPQIAKRKKKLSVVIVSTFEPAAGKTVGRSRKATLKLR
jgi:hypothetical protein